MRIIAGKAKGRRILALPRKSGLRPILARIRQSLFDILRTKVPGSVFLDLFAGTGAVGLEALSRGAERVVFVERNPQCLKVIEKNLARTGFGDRALVLRADAAQGLKWLLYRTQGALFDLVFLGPPYWQEEAYPFESGPRTPGSKVRAPLRVAGSVVEKIGLAGILDGKGWVVAQHHKKELLEVSSLELFRRSVYGDSVLSFFRHKGSGAP